MASKGVHPGGRPAKYDPKYCNEIITYFDQSPKQGDGKPTIFPTLERFAANIGVNGDTLVEWAKQYQEFSAAYSRAKDLQRTILIANGLDGSYNAQFAKFVAACCLDMHEVQEIKMDAKVQTVVDDNEAQAKLEALGYGQTR